ILDKTTPVKARLDASIGLDYSLKENLDVSGLVTLLRDAGEDFTLRESIPYVLGGIVPASYKAIPLLVEALDDKDHQTRILSAMSLGLIGKATDDIMIALVRTREDADLDVRRAADDALKQLQE
ncbi:HEAT repeat domain-containing protein, partial [Candidatus Sumerlaeota bacterium]|nr:HEAT repeat domain-containing protein [Candidatus Sumerlaeota bacterium]